MRLIEAIESQTLQQVVLSQQVVDKQYIPLLQMVHLQWSQVHQTLIF